MKLSALLSAKVVGALLTGLLVAGTAAGVGWSISDHSSRSSGSAKTVPLYGQ